MEHDYSTPSIMEKKILKGIPLEELDISAINEKDDLMIEDLGRSLSGILHVCDSYQMVCVSNPTINQVVSCSLDEMDKTYLGEYISEDINKEGTVQWIEQVQSPSSPLDVEGLLSATHVECPIKPVSLIYLLTCPSLQLHFVQVMQLEIYHMILGLTMSQTLL